MLLEFVGIIATFLNTGQAPPLIPLDATLKTARLILRRQAPEDYREWERLRRLSRPSLEPYEAAWTPSALSPQQYAAQTAHTRKQWLAGRGYSFHLFSGADQNLLGSLDLMDIRRGSRCTATFGYWLGTPYVGQGLMHEACLAALAFAFTRLKLRRLEASCMPANTKSLTLLQKLGFRIIGTAQAYLLIAGRPEDHLLLEKLA